METMTIKAALPPHLPADGHALLLRHAVARSFRRQTLIYSPGDPAEHLFLIESGEVKVSRFSSEGRELTLEHLGPGDAFGELEVLLGRPRESQALARLDGTLLLLEREQLRALADAEPAFGRWLTQLMSERQARLQELLETLLFKSANGKVAQVLLQLAADHGEATSSGTLINYPITHQEIGNLIATTRETVSYAFMEFRQRGLISTCQRKTVILDRDELSEVALA